jgi:hypothetical protein
MPALLARNGSDRHDVGLPQTHERERGARMYAAALAVTRSRSRPTANVVLARTPLRSRGCLVCSFPMRQTAGCQGREDRAGARVGASLFPPTSPYGCQSTMLEFARLGRAEDPLSRGAT